VNKKNNFWLYFIATPLAGMVLLYAWAVRFQSLAAGEDAFWLTVILLPLTVAILFTLGALMSRHAVLEFRTKRAAVTFVLLSAAITVLINVFLSEPLAQRACDACTGASFADAPIIFLLFFLPVMAGSIIIPLLHAKKS